MMVLPILLGQSKKYKTHAYLARTKVILYGLPVTKLSSLDFREFRARSETWNAFRLDRVMKTALEFMKQVECLIGKGVDEELFFTARLIFVSSGPDPKPGTLFVWTVMRPALEFIKQVECLIGKGVDEVLFFTVNSCLLQSGFNNQTTREKFEFFKFVWDIYSFHPKSYYTALGLEIDMQEDKIPPRSRTQRFMLLVDNLKVKFANIESSDGHFIVPSVEEILETFHQ